MNLYIRIKCKLRILKTMSVIIHYQKLGTIMYINNTQLTCTCSNSTIETLEEGAKYVQVNNENTRTTFRCFY